jgi:hypothetical protein
VFTPAKPEEVCPCEPEAAMLERLPGYLGVPKSVPKTTRLGADPELLTY